MVRILGVRVDNIDMVGAILKVRQFIEEKRFAQIITLNAEILYKAQSDEVLLELIDRAKMVTPDGNGVVWAAKKLGQDLTERVTGIDLMTEVCRHAAANKWRVFLLGGQPGVAQIAANNLLHKYEGIEIAGTAHGYFSKHENGEEEVLAAIKEAAPDMLFVALGAPKQDFWIDANKEVLGKLVAMGVGGSFDVIAGRVKRAPAFWQRLRLEWLWRLLLEPRRIGRVLALPAFTFKVYLATARMEKEQEPNHAEYSYKKNKKTKKTNNRKDNRQ